jgi:predicted RNase H-like HicB family nuclease
MTDASWDDYDTPWKEIVTHAFPEFMAFYFPAALARSEYKMLDDQTGFAEIPGFDGVWANASTVEACRSELLEVLEEWLILKIRDQDPIPTVEGLDLGIVESEAA